MDISRLPLLPLQGFKKKVFFKTTHAWHIKPCSTSHEELLEGQRTRGHHHKLWNANVYLFSREISTEVARHRLQEAVLREESKEFVFLVSFCLVITEILSFLWFNQVLLNFPSNINKNVYLYFYKYIYISKSFSGKAVVWRLTPFPMFFSAHIYL